MKMYPSTVEAAHRRKNEEVVERIIKNCRLSQLNFDCLGEIFQFLSTSDLIHLCQINPMVCDAIKERAIGKHHIDFSDWNQLWGTETIFSEFGAKIRSMAIHEWDFSQPEAASSIGDHPINQFLSMLVKNCTPNRIEELLLNFDFHGINPTQLKEARPYFSQLKKLIFASIIGRHPNSDNQELPLNTMIESAKQLSSIQLENTTSSGDWLRLNHMTNMENLVLVNSLVSNDENWLHYLTNQPKLTSFAWVHSTIPNYQLCENVARHCTDLERFFDVQFRIDDEEQYFQRDFVMSRYNYFASFQNLKCAQITAYTESGRDLIGAFMAMTRRNTIERLGINFLQNPAFKYTLDDMDYATQEYPEMQSLQSLQIENCTSCGFWNEILVKFLEATTNLNELSISGHERINSIQLTCIALVPSRMDVLQINQLIVADLELALKSISVGRAKNGNSDTLTVVVNSEQSMQLKGKEFCNIQFQAIEGCGKGQG